MKTKTVKKIKTSKVAPKKAKTIKRQNSLEDLLSTTEPIYGWFPITGHSMTNSAHSLSIPDGSLVLAKEVEAGQWNIPTNKPVLIMGDHRGQYFSVCKEIRVVDAAWNMSVKACSYNAEFAPGWIPFTSIKKILLIEEILRPGAALPFIVPLRRE
jgi:hypothetical protein